MNRAFSRSARHGGMVMLLAAILFLFGFVSFASAKGVTTYVTKPADVQTGTYRLLGYGCNSAQDIGNVAILQREDSPYGIGFSPRSHYFGDTKVLLSGLTADQAVAEAKAFVQCNPNATKTDVAAIHAPDGSLVGYEVTPVFKPLAFGGTPGVDTSYSVKGNHIIAEVSPDPQAQMNIQGGGG